MTDAEIQGLADGVASILLSYAGHGFATGAVEGMGEITLRDGLVVAAAAAGARLRQAWILKREFVPVGWTEAAVDLVVARKGNRGRTVDVGAIELKWWRRADTPNAGGRRRDIVKDLIRAASLYPAVEALSFVALLSTADSWNVTTATRGSDRPVITRLAATGSQTWRLTDLRACSSVRNAISALSGRVPIPNIFHTRLLSSHEIRSAGRTVAAAKVWEVKKPQRTRILAPADVDALLSRT